MNQKIQKFKNGIFAMRTNFGEFAELVLQRYFHLVRAEETSYNLSDTKGNKIEVAFSRAYRRGLPITAQNAIEICSNFETMIYSSLDAEKENSNYDCNIQQLNPNNFDLLYYGIFFSDKIEVFCAPRSVFPESPEKFYSNKQLTCEKLPGYSLQHKGGKEFQFHINKHTHRHHAERYHVADITYEQLYDLLSLG